MTHSAARLRIAYVLDVFDGIKTGGVLSAHRFVEALRVRHEVTVVSTGVAADGLVALPAFTPPPFGRVMREMGFVFAVPRRRVLEEVLRRVDLVHAQFPFWLGMRTASLARRLKVPLVAGFHVQPENMFANVGVHWPALDEWTYRFFLRRFYNLADAVVCPSPFALEALRRRGLVAPAEVISNGVPRWGSLPVATRPPAREGVVLVLVVGRLAREKRHDVIIEGVRRSRHAKRIQLVVTGRGPEEARVRQRAASLPRPAQVGFVSDAELDRLFATADVMVHASEVELEGMAVLEALGRGTPALIADARESATPQLAVSPEFLFRAGDPADLARRLDHLLDAPDRLEKARAEALALAARFDLADSVRRLEALYARVAKGAGARQQAALSAAAADRAEPSARSTMRPAGR
ncbi:MAG TPA: glycosyltransferase [Anaeromyxobacter sp.]|nr:glycosyltransferase [Anaeromyxobacter sp.]